MRDGGCRRSPEKVEQALRLALQATDSLTYDRLVTLAEEYTAQVAEIEHADPDNRPPDTAAD